MSEQLSGYNQRTGAESAQLGADYNTFLAQILQNSSSNLHGKIISKIVVKMYDNWGSSAGSIFAEIVDGAGNVHSTSNTINANTITDSTSMADYTFTFAGNVYPMNGTNLDYIRIKFDYGQASSSEIIGVRAVAGTNESNTYAASYTSPNWNTYSGSYDIAMDVYESIGSVQMQVGAARTTSSTIANANQYDALVATPTTFTDRTFDLSMQVYVNTTVVGTPNHLYTVLHNSTNKFAGLYINSVSAGLYGKKVTRCTFRIKKTGSPTGTLYCRLKKASDGSTITFGLNGVAGTGKDVSTLTTNTAPADMFSFENDANGQDIGGYACQTGDRIYLELSGGTSSAGTQVEVARTHTTSRIANVEMQVSTNGTTWTASDASGANDDDIIGIMYVGGYTPPDIFPYHLLGYGNTRITQKVTLNTVAEGNIYNQKITKIMPYLKKIGSPTGLINAVIRNAADALVASINTYDASSVTGSFTQISFLNLNQTYTMAVGDRICLEYSGGNVNDHIQVNANFSDTYPYGVLETYSGSSYATQTGNDMAGQMFSGGGSSDPLARTRVGEKVATTSSTIKLKTISRITVYLRKQSLPTGNITFRIRNAADAVVATLGTVAASSLTSTATATTVTSSPISVYALQVGDIVSVEYNAGDDANFVEVMTTKTTDGFDGVTNTYLSKYDDVNWVPNNAIDLVGQMWQGGDTYTPSQEDVVIPDPVYTKDLTVLAGSTPWTWVNHDLLTSISTTSQLYINAIMSDFRFYRKILTTTELENININRLDRANIAVGQIAKFGFCFIRED